MDNLPELKDIQIPMGVSFFPPAYGWWVILCGIVLLIILYEVFRSYRRKSKKIYALKLIGEVNLNNIIPAAITISEILRRICIFKYPSANSLYGKEWIDFLNARTKQTATETTANLLINAPYINRDSNSFTKHDIEDLVIFSKGWIGENL